MVIVRQTVCVKCECSRPFVNVSSCLTRASFLCFLLEKRFLEFSRFTSCLSFLTFGPICTHILSSRESWDFVRGICMSASRCDWFTQFRNKRRSCRGLPNGLSFWVQLPQGDYGFPGMQVLHLAILQRVSSCVTFRNHTRLLFRMTWTIIFCRCGRKRQFVPDLLSPDTSFVLKKAMIMKAICLPVNIGRFFFSCNSSSALRGLRWDSFYLRGVSSSWKTLRSACFFIPWTWNKESFVASRWWRSTDFVSDPSDELGQTSKVPMRFFHESRLLQLSTVKIVQEVFRGFFSNNLLKKTQIM